MFDLASGKEVVRLRGAGEFNRLAWSPDGTRVAGVGRTRWGNSDNGMLCVLTVPDGRRLAYRDGLAIEPRTVTFSPDGYTIATDLGSEVRLWEAATLRPRAVFGPAHGPPAFSPDGRWLVTGYTYTPAVLWDVRGPAGPPTNLDTAWADLGGDDAAAAYRAVRSLAAAPDRAVPYLAGKPSGQSLPDPDRVAALLRDLDAPAFADRDRADRELRRFGAVAEAALQRAAKESPSPEVRQRAGAILAAPPRPPAGAELRAVRSVEAVGWMDTPAAAKLLQRWATGDPRLRLTAEARATVARLHRR